MFKKFLSLVLILAFLSACKPGTAQSLGSPTEDPTRTPFAAFEVQKVPTITPTPGNILYADDFSSMSTGWLIEETSEGKFEYSAGEYFITGSKNNLIEWSFSGQDISDGILTVDIKIISGDPKVAGASIIWRFVDASNFYYLSITGDGHFSVNKVIADTWNTAYNDVLSPALKKTGESNKVTIDFQGETSDIYFNDQFAASIQDGSFTHGDIGLAAFGDETSGVEASFDNLKVYTTFGFDPNLLVKANPTATPAVFMDTSCKEWSEITLADVGKELCVWGDVTSSWYSDNLKAHIIVFSNDPKAFYFIMYGNWTFDSLESKCIHYKAKIDRVFDTPVIYIPEGKPLYNCK